MDTITTINFTAGSIHPSMLPSISIGGWHVIIDLLNSVPLSMNPRAVLDSIGQSPSTNGPPPLLPSPPPPPVAGHLQHSSSDDDHHSGGGGVGSYISNGSAGPGGGSSTTTSSSSTSLMSSSLSIIPQYQWPLETLNSSFSCMKLIVDEFLEAVMPNCELVSGLLQGLALFASQVGLSMSMSMYVLMSHMICIAYTVDTSHHPVDTPTHNHQLIR